MIFLRYLNLKNELFSCKLNTHLIGRFRTSLFFDESHNIIPSSAINFVSPNEEIYNFESYAGKSFQVYLILITNFWNFSKSYQDFSKPKITFKIECPYFMKMDDSEYIVIKIFYNISWGFFSITIKNCEEEGNSTFIFPSWNLQRKKMWHLVHVKYRKNSLKVVCHYTREMVYKSIFV